MTADMIEMRQGEEFILFGRDEVGLVEDPGAPQKIVSVWVEGRARPKGSMKNVARRGQKARLQEDNPHSAPWRARMVAELGLRTNFGRDLGFPVQLPVEVEVTFIFARPAGNETAYPTTEVGDLDKLLRNALDALQDARVIANDAQVVAFRTPSKVWAVDGIEGALITVWEAL